MRCIDDSQAPDFVYQCGAGHVFECSAVTQENTVYFNHCLHPACPACREVSGGKPFERGDRVAREVIPIVKHLARQGTVEKCDWSNEHGFSWHIWVRWDNQPGVVDQLDVTGNMDWPVRKLDPVEALAAVQLPAPPVSEKGA